MERSITSMLIAKAMIEIPFENVDFEFYKNLQIYFLRYLRIGACNSYGRYE